MTDKNFARISHNNEPEWRMTMENFIYSINATLPIFLIMILGKILFHVHIINEHFTKTADKFVFYVGLPSLIFKDLAMTNVGKTFNAEFVLFCFSTTLLIIRYLVFHLIVNEKQNLTRRFYPSFLPKQRCHTGYGFYQQYVWECRNGSPNDYWSRTPI